MTKSKITIIILSIATAIATTLAIIGFVVGNNIETTLNGKINDLNAEKVELQEKLDKSENQASLYATILAKSCLAAGITNSQQCYNVLMNINSQIK